MVVHTERTLTHRQLLTSWALLSASAGAVNAAGLLACQRFVSHITGTATRIGVDAPAVLALDYLLVLSAFIGGAAAAIRLARAARPVPSSLPGYWVPLVLVALILVTVALLGHAGSFDAFGRTVEAPHDFMLIGALSFAMGMQNAAVAASTGMAVRTTHLTGPATDIGVALALLSSTDPQERAAARTSLVLRGTKLCAFIAGGAVMAMTCARFEFLSFLLPAVTILVGTALGFMPRLRYGFGERRREPPYKRRQSSTSTVRSDAL